MDVTDTNFDNDVIEKSKEMPVLVDFWASWCMPCRMLGPTLESIAKKHEGKFILLKLNVDDNPQMSQRYSIMSIPCIKLFKNGKLVDEFVGALPEEAIESWLSKHME